MFGSPRIIVAAIALTMASLGHSQVPKSDQSEANKHVGDQLARIAATVEKIPTAAASDPGCSPTKDDRRSDLCAQWKSADAATQSAFWSLWMVVLSVFGLFIGGGTLFAAWRAAHWAKEAAVYTKAGSDQAAKAADATLDAVRATQTANEIAQDTSYRQLRAYVSAESANIEVWRDGDLNNIRLEITLYNSGATTATVIRKKAKFQSGEWKCISDRAEKTIISPQGREPITIECGTGGMIESLNIVARMFIEYHDYLGEPHTEDSFWSAGSQFPLPAVRKNYVLACHSKIDETIGKFIDPSGEEVDAKRAEEAIRQFQNYSDRF